MKKTGIIAFYIIFCIILTSCAANAEETVPDYDIVITSENADLLGYEYIIAAGTHGGGQVQLAPEPGSDIRGDRLLQRYKDVEDKFNMKLTVIGECNLGAFMTLWAAGMKYADLVIAQAAEMATGRYVQNGFFLPFSDMDIDLFSGLYGTQGMLDAGCFNGKYYCIMSYYWGLPSPYTMPAMWYNPRVLSTYQQAMPHELEEQGEWNWAAFEKICEAVHDTSSPSEKDHVYAVSALSEPFLELAAMYSNGARPVTKGEDGKLYCTLNSKNTLEALEFIKSLEDRKLIGDRRNADNQDVTEFVENRNAFFLQYTHSGLSSEDPNNLANRMNDAYEWTMFPTGPSYDPSMSRTAYSYHSRFYFAPGNSDPEVHSVVLPFLFQPLPGETTETWQDVLERNNFFSKESFEIYCKIRDEAFYDYAPYIPYTDMNGVLSKITTGSAVASEAMESIESSIQASLDKLYNDYID